MSPDFMPWQFMSEQIAAEEQAERDRLAVEALLATCVPADRRSLASRLYNSIRRFIFRPTPENDA